MSSRKIRGFGFVIGLLFVVLIANGCSIDNSIDNKKVVRLEPDIEESKVEEWVVKEVDDILNYTYLGLGDRPEGEIGEYIEKLKLERKNQRVYIDEYMQELSLINKEARDLVEQKGNNTVDDIEESDVDNRVILEQDGGVFIDENEETGEWREGKLAAYILKDVDGRYYIDLEKAVIDSMDGKLYFEYGGGAWILELNKYKETLVEMGIKKHTYKYIWGKEVGDEEYELLYRDKKTGLAKLIMVKVGGDKIEKIRFEL